MDKNELTIEKIMTSLINYWNPVNYIDYSSKVDRMSFWIVYFANMIILSSIYSLAQMLHIEKSYMLISSILYTLPQLAFIVRRSNDCGFKRIFPIVFYCIPSVLMLDLYYNYYVYYDTIQEFSKLITSGNSGDSTMKMIVPFIESTIWLAVPALVSIISFTMIGLKDGQN